MANDLVERTARIVELAVIRHGVEESALEGTLDDAQAILEAIGSETEGLREALSHARGAIHVLAFVAEHSTGEQPPIVAETLSRIDTALSRSTLSGEPEQMAEDKLPCWQWRYDFDTGEWRRWWTGWGPRP